MAPAGSGSDFTVDVSNETLRCTTLDDWQPGRRVNLERALKAGDELGGHIVAGHVDGVGPIVDIAADGEVPPLHLEASAEWALHGPQGLGGVDGVSLTVNEVAQRHPRSSASTSSRTP